MSEYRQFEDDDLAMYAMGLLATPEASAVARQAEERLEVRNQLAEVQARLAAYAQTAVELHEVPVGSLERLMSQIAVESKSPAGPQLVAGALAAQSNGITRSVNTAKSVGTAETVGTGEAEKRTGSGGRVLPWLGWAVAAALAVTTGKFYQDRVDLHRMLTAQTGHVVQMSADTADVSRDRQALQASAAEQARKIQELTAENARVTGESAKAAAESQGLRSQTADQARQVAQQAGEIGQMKSEEARTEQKASSLEATLAEQTSQIAQLSTEAARSREVLEALTDRTALRVTLTRPKSQPAPTGRATYVASRGTLVFQANNLAALRPNKVYQLWLLPADGAKPVSVGTFSPDGRGSASLVYPRLTAAVPAKGFAITIENSGGATTPTMPLILAGTGG